MANRATEATVGLRHGSNERTANYSLIVLQVAIISIRSVILPSGDRKGRLPEAIRRAMAALNGSCRSHAKTASSEDDSAPEAPGGRPDGHGREAQRETMKRPICKSLAA